MNFILWHDGQAYGPYDLDSVEASIASGDLSPETFARIEGGADWKKLETLLAELKQSKKITRAKPKTKLAYPEPPPQSLRRPAPPCGTSEPIISKTNKINLRDLWEGLSDLLCGLCGILVCGEFWFLSLIVCFFLLPMCHNGSNRSGTDSKGYCEYEGCLAPADENWHGKGLCHRHTQQLNNEQEILNKLRDKGRF